MSDVIDRWIREAEEAAMKLKPRIVILHRPGRELDGRPVLVIGRAAHSSDPDTVEVEMLENQWLPREKRMICIVYLGREVEELSLNRQEQIASTMGLRLDRLPY